MIQTNHREINGKEIAEKTLNQIRRINPTKYQVKSQSRDGKEYTVFYTRDSGWVCTCNDSTIRHKKCKHLWSLEFRGIIKSEPERKHLTTVIEEIQESNSVCPYCSSARIVKNGRRYNKYKKIQRFACVRCKKTFSTYDIGFERMKYNPREVTLAMQLYFNGQSLRNVADSLRLIGVNISHQTIYKWITKYTKLMQEYLDEVTVPKVGNTWRADEVYVKIRGRERYLFSLMDDYTRFWIAKEVADTKGEHDARNLLSMGKYVTGTKPKLFITDGLGVYQRAFYKEFHEQSGHSPKHIRSIRISGEKNNNKMERLNGEFRDREKVMRGIKKNDSSMIHGYQLFHNYIRPHTSLRGKTPAEVCGIRIEGENKWKTLIQNAKRKTIPKQYSITDYFGQEMKIPATMSNGYMYLKPC